MDENQNFNLKFISIIWILIFIILFVHTKNIYRFKFLEFREAKGSLEKIEMGYKNHNIIALDNIVYGIPHGVTFYHPNRIKKLTQSKVYQTFSVEKVKSLIDTGSNEFRVFDLIEKYKNFNIFKENNSYLSTKDKYSNIPELSFYTEYFISESLEELKKKIDKNIK